MNEVALVIDRGDFMGGMGLVDMAMCLAECRAGEFLLGFWTRHHIEPCARNFANPATHQVSANYYVIIDRLARGETP